MHGWMDTCTYIHSMYVRASMHIHMYVHICTDTKEQINLCLPQCVEGSLDATREAVEE